MTVKIVSLKRKYSISGIAVSIVLFLILAVVPHHHHRGIACIVIELCEQDNEINDEHTHHSDTSSEKSHDENCIAESKFTIPLSIDETKYKPSVGYNNTFLFPILFLLGNLYNPYLISIKSDYGEYILNYKATEVSRSYGLRAPPYLPA